MFIKFKSIYLGRKIIRVKEVKLGYIGLTTIDKIFSYHHSSILKKTHIIVCDDFALEKV